MEAVCALPKDFLFLNYLRCHDDIGWGLDYPWLAQTSGTDEVAHKKFLNDWFTGKWPGSPGASGGSAALRPLLVQRQAIRLF